MYSIGVDLHKENLVLEVLDGLGATVERRTFATKCKNVIRDYFSSYGLQCQVAFESVGFYHWFWELVHPVVGKLSLADPVGVRAHAGRKAKTDRNDAHLIAQLLHEGRLPAAHVPDEPYASLRKLVRLRHSVARRLAGCRKALRWVCLRTNLPGPSVLTSDRAQKWLLAQDGRLSGTDRTAGRLHVDMIISMEHSLSDIERDIADFIGRHAGLRDRAALLKTIPGVGTVTAATIMAETSDILRFERAEEIASYAGLSPRISQSGETVRHGHISKMGPPLLRWTLQQAAWVAIRSCPEVRKIYCRISRKAGNKKAATAIARKLLVYAWSVCRRNKPFQWPGKQPEQAAKEKTTEGGCYQI